jgi:hypothetical protein
MPVRSRRRLVLLAAMFAVVTAVSWLRLSSRNEQVSFSGVDPGASMTAEGAFDARQSDVWVEDEGTVVAMLADDLEGSRHQRFLVRLSGGTTILVSHNIDLAPRVPIEKGDAVSVRGEYIWNEKGGLVHWTHRDPRGRRQGGWIMYRGRRYR